MTEDDMLDLLTKGERQLRLAYAEVISYLRVENSLADVEKLIAAGHVDDALRHVERAAGKITERIEQVYTMAALATARSVTTAGVMTSFQATHPTSIMALDALRLDKIREFTAEQVSLTRQVLRRGLERGHNPRKMARELRESIGLTMYQEQLVDNYRMNLERGQYSAASRRQLHDGRYDQTLRAFRRRDEPLDGETIDRMVDRYRFNWVAHRAENIARTEALSAVHLGSDMLYTQALDRRELQAEQLECTWHAGSAPRTRDWHATMDQQKRAWRVPFTSGLGNSLMFPGDPDASAEERANCRCARSVRVLKNGKKVPR